MSNLHILLQVRTNSSRLPAKCLFNVSKYPVFLLAAKRLGNCKHKVTILTSTHYHDDEIVRIANKNKIKVFRGHLNNVLKRFIDFSIGLNDETIIVRATADNLFPDGYLVSKMQKVFKEKNKEYLFCEGKKSNAPIGLSLEMFRLGSLRKFYKYAVTDFDREHVTCVLKKNVTVHTFKINESKKKYKKAGIDELKDYTRILNVFDKVKKPISMPYFNLIKLLRI